MYEGCLKMLLLHNNRDLDWTRQPSLEPALHFFFNILHEYAMA
jgi:hypothetical protein